MPKRTKQIDFPEANHPFLNDAISSFRKRARAIKAGGGTIKIQRVVERNDKEEIEKIEITLKNILGPQVSLSIWSDRWVWVHAGHLTKRGWLWEWSKEGRLVGAKKEIDLCRKAEETMNVITVSPANAKGFCETLWTTSIATGPRVVSVV